MIYQEALEYLNSFAKFGSNLGLQRMEVLLERIGNPERTLNVIHVAGTNGKGSLCAMVGSILLEAGYNVGMYTSPHLSSFTERIKINGRDIEEDDVARALTKLKPHVEAVSTIPNVGHPTEFEVITTLALMYFAEKSLDYVILEVGLGGRLDATNVVEPHISVITHIDYDHMERLGNTLSEIAAEKGGIIKSETLTVIGPQEPEAMNVLKKIAEGKGAPLITVDKSGDKSAYDIVYSNAKSFGYSTIFDVACSGSGWRYEHLRTSLLGEHQATNGAIAIGVIEGLNRKGAKISEDAIRLGLLRTIWPGRLEVVNERPIVLLDGAHNLDGARALRKSIQEIFDKKSLASNILVTGILGDKDVDKMLEILMPMADGVVTTLPDSPRAMAPELLAEKVRKYCHKVEVESDPIKAVYKGLSMVGQNGMVCVCGSLYLIGAIRPYLVRKRRVTIFVGAFGSGKTEVAINYSIRCARRGEKVKLVDLDIVNPYFRSREMRSRLQKEGVEVIYSTLESDKPDLPALSPKILSALYDPEASVIFDVGGDDLGATVLGRFESALKEIDYDMYFVVNTFRPLTQDVEGILCMCQEISKISRLQGSGLICNINLGEEIKSADIINGYNIIKKASNSINLPIRFISINERLIKEIVEADINAHFQEEIFPLKLFMRLPWLKYGET